MLDHRGDVRKNHYKRWQIIKPETHINPSHKFVVNILALVTKTSACKVNSDSLGTGLDFLSFVEKELEPS